MNVCEDPLPRVARALLDAPIGAGSRLLLRWGPFLLEGLLRRATLAALVRTAAALGFRATLAADPRCHVCLLSLPGLPANCVVKRPGPDTGFHASRHPRIKVPSDRHARRPARPLPWARCRAPHHATQPTRPPESGPGARPPLARSEARAGWFRPPEALSPDIRGLAQVTSRPQCYALIPVIAMPSIKVRWVKKKSTRMGRMVAVLAAIR